MPASASFNFDDGMRTLSCMATLALRMRVSMSAIGSVIVIVEPPGGHPAGPPPRQGRGPLLRPARYGSLPAAPSPAGLGDTGQLTGVRQLAHADTAQPELAVHRVRPAAAAAPGVGPHLELGLALLLLNKCLLCHYCCPSLRKGKPNASSSALPSA